MKRIFLLAYFSFLTFILAAQDPVFVLLETDTVFTTSCDSVDYCVHTGNPNAYPSSEVTVNGIVSEAVEFCSLDTVSSYGFFIAGSNGPWAIETEVGGQSLNFTVNSLAEIADTFNLYYPDCMWEYDEGSDILICYGSNLDLGSITITINTGQVATIFPNATFFFTGFILRLDYGENEIIMTHEDGYADTSIVSVIHEEQILESVELNLSVGESETYLAESQCGSELFTYVNLCEANSTGTAELLTNGSTYEIKAVAAGVDTVCVQYTDEFGFNTRQDFYLSVLTSTEDIVDLDLDIYPNPTTDFINISTRGIGNLIEIQDVNGQVILSMLISNETERINIANFPNGIYFLSAKDIFGKANVSRFVKM